MEEAAQKLSAEHEQPSVETRDSVLFIINNLTTVNLEQKAPELLALIDDFMPWFAQYLVIKRVATEQNFIDLYVSLLANANNKKLYSIMIQTTYYFCQVLVSFRPQQYTNNERTMLKNLGVWLGSITLKRNRPILQK